MTDFAVETEEQPVTDVEKAGGFFGGRIIGGLIADLEIKAGKDQTLANLSSGQGQPFLSGFQKGVEKEMGFKLRTGGSTPPENREMEARRIAFLLRQLVEALDANGMGTGGKLTNAK